VIRRFDSPIIPSTNTLSVTGDRVLHPEEGDEGKTSLTAEAAVR
jgi:hypothetical protein